MDISVRPVKVFLNCPPTTTGVRVPIVVSRPGTNETCVSILVRIWLHYDPIP
jgi:hypothetical protein